MPTVAPTVDHFACDQIQQEKKKWQHAEKGTKLFLEDTIFFF